MHHINKIIFHNQIDYIKTIKIHFIISARVFRNVLFACLILSLGQCVKKEADGKEYCSKNCKSACEMASGNVSSCIKECVPACENSGPNPFYNKN